MAGAAAVELLIDQAWEANDEDRYERMVAAGGRAVAAAEALDDPALLVLALVVEATGLRMLGDDRAALARYTRVLALAEDPARRHHLTGEAAAWAIAQAYTFWVESARFLTDVPYRKLFAVLDAAETWLTATGHRHWRATVLLQRASLHHALGENDAAIARAEEALAAYRPGAPGATLGTYRSELGDILRDAGRPAHAVPHYQAILDDPDSGPNDQQAAHKGLAYCALAADQPAEARRHATHALALAEPLGDDNLCTALEVLTEACRAGGDLDTAWTTARRHLDTARRIGDHYRPYYAVRAAIDVALDRADLPTARHLLTDLEDHATALDTASATTAHTADASERRERLADLDADLDASSGGAGP